MAKPHIRLMRTPPGGTMWRKLWICSVFIDGERRVGVGETEKAAYEELMSSLSRAPNGL